MEQGLGHGRTDYRLGIYNFRLVLSSLCCRPICYVFSFPINPS